MARIDYASWERISLSVANIKLDRQNPRIPDYVSTYSTRDILHYLFEHGKIYRLAEKIVNKGFISHDPIYVVKEGTTYVVVEGNRRISALKCLLEPALAPPNVQKKLEKLQNKLGSESIPKIEVYVAPSRTDIENVLFELHSEGKLQWSRQQKNKFIVTASDDNGKNINELAARFAVNVSDIHDAVQEYYLERYFTELGLPTDVEEKALNEKFPISNMSRLLNNAYFKNLTGFPIEQGKLVTTISKIKFDYLISKFIIDILHKKINSRVLNKSSTTDKYLKDAYDSMPEQQDDLSPVSFNVEKKNNNIDNPPSTKSKTTKKTKTLIPADRNYLTGHSRLDLLLQEAQGILLGIHKNASALLLRTILELSIIRIFDIYGKKDQCLNQNGRVKNLSDNMAALLKRDQWFSNKTYLSDLTAFTQSNTSWNTLNILNRYVHGEYVLPNKDDLESLWLIIEPLIDMCATEIVKATK